MGKFKVGDTVKGVYFNSIGKVISTDAYGTNPLVVSWLDGGISRYIRDSDDIEVIKKPRVLWVGMGYSVSTAPFEGATKFVEVIE